MIRPFTCLCLLLAGGSGLYLYQSKHRVELLDQQIETVVRQTQAARARIGVLRAEWALMNDPERLTDLAGRFLTLRSTTPAQFTNFADLDARLPPVPVPATEGPAPDATTDQPAVAEAAPVPAKPEPAPELAAAHPAPVSAPAKAPVRIAVKAKPAHEQVAQVARPERARVTPVSITTLGRPPGYPASPYSPPYAAPYDARPPAPAASAPPVPMVASALGMARMMPSSAPYASAQ